MESFDRFCQQHSKRLRQIVRATRGEYQYGDVVNEAWLLAHQLSTRYSLEKDFLNLEFQDLLLRHLYQSLVRYTDLNVRHAMRLDHDPGQDAEDGAQHPLMNLLSSDQGRDPLFYLIEHENAILDHSSGEECFSLAAAWVVLLHFHEQRMHSIARRLLISASHAYHCCAKAALIATMQKAIPFKQLGTAAQLGPWRRARVIRIPQQLEFDFEEELELT